MSDEGMKYIYVKRRLYDNYVDRTAKRFDRILHQLAVQESWTADLKDQLEVLEAEVESLRLQAVPGHAVTVPGRKDALHRQS